MKLFDNDKKGWLRMSKKSKQIRLRDNRSKLKYGGGRG